MTTQIRPLKRNYRYRLVIHDWNYYVLDTEKNPLSIFFPWLFWFTKHPIYQINHEVMESLRETTLATDDYPRFRWTHLIIVFLLPVIRPIYEYILSISRMQSNFILWIVIGSFIGLRLYIRKRYENKFVNDQVDLTELPKQTVIIKPSQLTQWGYHIGMTIFFDLGIIFGLYFYITNYLLGALLTVILFLPIRLFIFTLFFSNPSMRDSYDYHLQILEK